MADLFDLLIGAAVAGLGYLFADEVTKNMTGKHIHEHVYQWWCDFRESIQEWLQQYPNMGIVRIVGVITSCVDTGMVNGKKSMDAVLSVHAVDRQNRTYEVRTDQVPLDEVLKMFPDFQHSNPVNISPELLQQTQ